MIGNTFDSYPVVNRDTTLDSLACGARGPSHIQYVVAQEDEHGRKEQGGHERKGCVEAYAHHFILLNKTLNNADFSRQQNNADFSRQQNKEQSKNETI
jgi:hypothetical protein